MTTSPLSVSLPLLPPPRARAPSSPLSSATPSPRAPPQALDKKGSSTPDTPSTVPLPMEDQEGEGSLSGSSDLTDDDDVSVAMTGADEDEIRRLGEGGGEGKVQVNEELNEEIEVEQDDEEQMEGDDDELKLEELERRLSAGTGADTALGAIRWTSPSLSLSPPPSSLVLPRSLPIPDALDVSILSEVASPSTGEVKGKGKGRSEEGEEDVLMERGAAEMEDGRIPMEEEDKEDGDVTMRVEAIEGDDVVDVGDTIGDERMVEEDPPGEPTVGDDHDQVVIMEAGQEATTDQPEADTPVLPHQARLLGHSSHAPPPSQAALRRLLELELKFAALRDRLYVERMDEAAREEEMVHNGTHLALKYLYRTLAGRRERLHEVASRRHQETLLELKKAREADKDHTWTWWTDERDRSHWNEFEQTWSKRRRLAREKNELETPRIVRPIPRAAPIRPVGWQVGATPMKLGMEEAALDLAAMERRQPMQQRHASPSVFVPQAPPHYPMASSSSSHHTIPTHNHNSHAAYPQQQPRQSTAGSLLARTISAGASQTAQPQTYSHTYLSQTQSHPPQNQYRREGRTVPTSSDMFDKRRNGLDSTNSGSGSSDSMLGAWAKQHDQRPVVNGDGNGNGNGAAHSHGNGGGSSINNSSSNTSHLNPGRSPPPPAQHHLPPIKDNPPASQMMNNRTHTGSGQGNRYPGLSDYLSGKGISSPPNGVVGGGMGYLGALGGESVVDMLDGLMSLGYIGRSPFSREGSGQTGTVAGTPQQR